MFLLVLPVHPSSSGQNPESCKMVVVVVVVVTILRTGLMSHFQTSAVKLLITDRLLTVEWKVLTLTVTN